MLSDEGFEKYNKSPRFHEAQRSVDDGLSPTISSQGLADATASRAISFTPDPHTVPLAEALSYYSGLPSEPTLLYRTGKEQWSSPKGPEAQRRTKELYEIFDHPIAQCWNKDLGWKVVAIMDDHSIRFTTIDVVRFKKIEVDEPNDDEEDDEGEDDNEDEEPTKTKKRNVGPVTIWIGVFPDTTTPTAACNAAQEVLALLNHYRITDVDVDFRESFYTREAGPQLLKPVEDLHPLVDVISPLTPALGLGISTKAWPEIQGTMALYLAEGGIRNRFLGLSCRHVLIGQQEGNADYRYNRSAPSKDVLLLGDRAYEDLLDSIKVEIERQRILINRWTKQLAGFLERESGTDQADVRRAAASRIFTQMLLDRAKTAKEALPALLERVSTDWKNLDDRVLGHVLRSPAIALGVGEHRFTEDWGIFQVDRAKLGDGFQGNKLDLGTKMSPDEFVEKCFPRGDADWKFEFPLDRLLPLKGTITDELMRAPDMWDADGKPCLLVVKNGNATGITIGRATGVFSIVREYSTDMTSNQTSMEWAIINYDSKSDVFSEPGDSGSIIADLHGRIGGLLTGGSGKTNSSDITYATPFWWLLQRIKANGFPDAHLDVLA
ncbi:hypothetical protein F5J12DRAFT_767781 [Pisolithus orientalis]|uniref:uncharacterized protein n=1 Tax=Pisolithus orientalis TaxID=936130 RepID=UPI0022250FDB|nr:uncharacterized protein F5J12DRAFT_767781 [Pisolithus orientalis]KAI6008150.1 hypothetical protein F5J12DRAFT_767781 [Pisolithus orientalis]